MWWVIPEGTLGKLVNALASGATLNLFTVTQSHSKPNGAVAGPYASQAMAQAKANQLNQQNVATPSNVVSHTPLSGLNAVGDLAQRLTQSSTWVRVGEFVAGGILLYVGLKQLFPTAINTVSGAAKKAGKVVVK